MIGQDFCIRQKWHNIPKSWQTVTQELMNLKRILHKTATEAVKKWKGHKKK